MDDLNPTYTLFVDQKHLLTAGLPEVLTHLKNQPQNPHAQVLVFEDQTGRTVDFDLRGTLEEVLVRHLPSSDAEPARAGRGRPRLGVVAREVTLFPRHWEWLEQQPGGASAALRRLIEEARKQQPDLTKIRQAQTAADRFMSVIAGDLPGYQEASRALYARDFERFQQEIQPWPEDIRGHAERLAGPVFESADGREPRAES
ncbi:DUF2239 family protein [Deinococcus roseus]|uniref:DUF2239 domain-containing protein n=1 Tax=Deinococcus roseus TaxID=392414 RepID=A0ABQ2CWP3_9DEIO|nr:DUF2239 family protein [Deinococcus roseus]GGJ28122.1 hypothetical protein GCM10008938_12790 [Deinococcus roseus]